MTTSYHDNTPYYRWLSTRLEMTGHCVIFLTSLTSVLRATHMDAAQAGLAISTAMGVSRYSVLFLQLIQFLLGFI